MQRYRESRYSQHGDYDYDSALSPYDQYDNGTAQETDSFCSARETLYDVDESDYPMQDQHEETSFTQYDRLNKLSEQQRPIRQLKQPSQRRDLYQSQQTAQPAANLYHPSNKSSKSREYAQEGPSSLQTRLNSFAVPRSRRAIALPPREDSSVYESVHTVEDINLPSPTRSRPILHQSLCLFVWNL
jgi:hypothetical protein